MHFFVSSKKKFVHTECKSKKCSVYCTVSGGRIVDQWDVMWVALYSRNRTQEINKLDACRSHGRLLLSLFTYNVTLKAS